MIPVFVRAASGEFFEDPGEMGAVRVAHPHADISDAQARIPQQFLCRVDADPVQKIVKTLLTVFVQQFGKMSLGNITDLSNILERQFFCIMFLHVSDRLVDDETAGVLITG